MLYLNVIKSVVEKALWSGWLIDERPISVLIVADPESFKTELLKKYKHNGGIIYMTDVTAYGLTKAVFPLIDVGQVVNHIIIPDLLNPLTKQLTTARSFIQFMNSLIEEGIVQIQTYAIQIEKKDINCGLITAITPNSLRRRRKYWGDIGFTSRLLPLSYSYDSNVNEDILKSIINSKYHDEEDITINFPKEKVKIEDNPKVYETFLKYTHQFATAHELYGFRYQKQLQVLAKANALSQGRKSVENEDADWINSVAEYINLECKRIGVP